MANSTIKQHINPPDVRRASRSDTLESGTIKTITSTGAYYCVGAINTGTVGNCSAYMLGTDDTYISASESGNGDYKRAITEWIYYPAGTTFKARAIFTDTTKSGVFKTVPVY